MPKKQKLHVKIGDIVTVISGFHKNETGEVIKINRNTGKIVVKGINFKFKHVKPNTENEIGEIKQFEAPIHHSNVKLNLKETYTWASGWKSPIYCDNRKVLSFPYVRDFIKSEMCNVIFEKFPDADLLAGVATAGIAWGAMAADQLKLPFIYVRPKPKEHGLGNQIEGTF